MIDKNKIDIYLKNKGFYEGFEKKYYNKERPITDNEWFLIDELISESSLMLKQLSSEQFNRVLEMKLIKNCNNSETIEYLKKSSLEKRF